LKQFYRRKIAPELGRLCSEHEIAIFRIIQESLGNIYRHSGSPVAHIAILSQESNVVLEVRDRGRGLPVENNHANTGVGVKSMQERLRTLGGSLQIDSSDSGRTVRAILPTETRLDLALTETIRISA
jgi:signal transduction histidine kinase